MFRPKSDEEREIEQFAVKLLALRQPVADDLRHVVAALKVVTDLERIDDYITNIAEQTYYAIMGDTLPDFRPKSGRTSTYAGETCPPSWRRLGRRDCGAAFGGN